MRKIEKNVLIINKNIEKNIEEIKIKEEERGFYSQNILKKLRDFVEHTALLIYSNGNEIENYYDNIKKALNFIKSQGQYRFLNKFHNFLQIAASHYTVDEDAAERLMLKYYQYLLQLKNFLKEQYNLEVLKNIDEFPINIDKTTQEYYEKIVSEIENKYFENLKSDRYYIQKIKPFFVNGKVYYEVTFTRASDNITKFDRIIAFTRHDIPDNYAVKLWIRNDSINILSKNMPIRIIEKWETSIRPCELNNFAPIFDISCNIQSSSKEYLAIMEFLTKTNYNLVDLVLSDKYKEIIGKLKAKANTENFLSVLDKCHEKVKNNLPGSNVLRYLLYTLRNKIIKTQYGKKYSCGYFSGLNLKCGCIPFDQMPFCSSLINHNPRLDDLFECIDFSQREHEFLARIIKNNTEIKGELYTRRDEIHGFQNIDKLIKKYNNLLYKKHIEKRSLKIYKNFIYIAGYESDTIEIVKKIKELAKSGVKGYAALVNSWLKENPQIIDCDEKREIVKRIFENSHVAIIYGAAGTGKSTLINHISQLFNTNKKLYLAQTNPAVDNLKRKVTASNSEFMTITKFLRNSPINNYDLIIIDECSTVSNSDMAKILNKANFKLLVLVGDTYQIEAIRFGNWFSLLKHFVPKSSIAELTIPYRTKNEKLLKLWNKVRNLDDDIEEHLVENGYTAKLDNSIFERRDEIDDEIILVLNYDGFYGINNINNFLQANNSNAPVYWEDQVFKIGDPVLFNETKRFGSGIYNNLKGKIVGIEKHEKYIQFEIEIYKSLNELEIDQSECEFENLGNGHSIIKFEVNKYKSTDEDNESPSDVIPFQIAYAVSIHKAQGLEYDSVKVVISNEVDELITHSIFYTAITRARNKLKIYWTPETQHKILSKLPETKRNIGKDIGLLKSKLVEKK